jgi:hypothetical protein
MFRPRKRASQSAANASLISLRSPTHLAFGPPRPLNLLESDKRLVVAMPPFTASTVTTPRVCALLRDASRVPMFVQKGEMQSALLFLTFRKMSAWKVMDAVAALWLARWGQTDGDGYQLMTSADEIRNTFTPKNAYKRRRNEAGMKFLSAMDGLPPGVRADLRAGKPVSVASLTPELQARLGEMVDALNQERVANDPDNQPFPLSLLVGSTITFSVSNFEQVKDYWVQVSNSDWGSSGFAFDDYEYNNRRRAQARAAQRPGTGNGSGARNTGNETVRSDTEASDTREFSPVKFEITQKEARTLPELRQAVRIERRRVTLPLVLREMHDRYGTPLVADAPAFQTEVRDVSIDVATLPMAFDRLTQIYRDTQWEYRASGFFVVRSATNPARLR